MEANKDIFLKFVENIASKPNTKLLTKEQHVKVCQFLSNGPTDEYDRQKIYDMRSKITKKRYELISTDPTNVNSKKERVLVVPQPDRVSFSNFLLRIVLKCDMFYSKRYFNT